jgi:hypothetical protein
LSYFCITLSLALFQILLSISLLIKYSSCSCILSTVGSIKNQIHSIISEITVLFIHTGIHQADIHSNKEIDQLSATDGKQNILAFQNKSLYS